MGSTPYSKRPGCTIEDREVTNPLLFEKWEEAPMLDIREAAAKNREDGVIGTSGADAFFCNTFACIKEKDEVSKLCGFESHDDVLTKLMNRLCEEYKDDHDRIKSIQKGFAKKEKLIEALATKLGYDGIEFSENGVSMTTKDNYSCHYPPTKWKSVCGVMKKTYGDESWDA